MANRKDFTWFYPEQIEALKALYEAIHRGCGVPLEAPKTKWAYDYDCANGKFRGFMNHFHCSKKKIDCGGLDIEKLLEENSRGKVDASYTILSIMAIQIWCQKFLK